MAEWSKTSLGELVVLEYGKALRDYRDGLGSVRVFGANGPVGWTTTAQSEGPGVIVGRKGAYRGVHYSTGPFWVIDTAYFVRPLVPLDLKWVYYSLRNQDINSLDSGSAIPSTSRDDFYALSTMRPPLSEQSAISTLLEALDDKIALNDRAVSTVTQLAEAVYLETARSPERVRVVKLKEAAKWVSGGTPKTDDASYWSGSIPWISAASLRSFVLMDSDRRVTDLGVANGTRLVPAGTTLCVVRGMSLKTEVRLGIAVRPVAFGQDCKAFIPKHGIGSNVLAVALRSKRDILLGLVDEAGHGTGRLDSSLLGDLELEMPIAPRMSDLEARLAALIRISTNCIAESATIARLRDVLLPKLMSGEIRVREAEKVVGEVL